jgi:hypothetical protein
MTRSLLALIVPATLLTSCGDATPRLADVEDRHIEVEEFYRPDHEFEVVVGHSCRALDSGLQGTANGVPLVVKSYGGVETAGFDERCQLVTLVGTTPGPGDVSIRVWDSTASMEADLPELFSPRRLEIAAPGDHRVYVGDEVTLRRWPPTDTVIPTDAKLAADQVTVESKYWTAIGRMAGDTIVFTAGDIDDIALNPNVASKEALSLPARIMVPASRCAGAKQCRGFPDARLESGPVNVFHQEREHGQDCYQCHCDCADGMDGGTGSGSIDGKGVPIRCSLSACRTSCSRDGGPASFMCTATTP